MRNSLLLGAAISALFFTPVAISQTPFFKKANTESQALTIDPVRGVLTMAPLLEKVTPAVVSLEVTSISKRRRTSDGLEDELLERFFGGRPDRDGERQERRRGSIGSGVIVDAGQGYIITNHHVVDGAEEIYAVLEDRRQIEAELVGSDEATDIALLKIKGAKLADIPFANDSNTKVGDYVVAVGNPFGLGHTVTSGIISAQGRELGRSDNYQDFLQTDASINPGNSGGALVNSKGELIGINTAIVSRSGGNNGIGFAVPTKMVRAVMAQLIAYGEVRRGRIGVTIQNIGPELQEALDLPTSDGALIGSVAAGSGAEKAGLKEGDIITAFNGERILDSSDIRNAVGLLEPGKSTDIEYIRDGKTRTTKITVLEFEEDRTVLDEEAEVDIPAMERFSGATITDIPDDMNLRGGEAGVYVAEVRPLSRASRAGIRKGDIIRAVNRQSVRNLKDFEKALEGQDGAIALSIERDGNKTFIPIR